MAHFFYLSAEMKEKRLSSFRVVSNFPSKNNVLALPVALLSWKPGLCIFYQGCAFFDAEFDDAIYIDLNEEIEKLATIFLNFDQ